MVVIRELAGEFRAFFIATILCLLISSCSEIKEDSLLDTHYEALLCNPDSVFSDHYFDKFDSSRLSIILSSLSYENFADNKLFPLNGRLKQIIQQKKENHFLITSNNENQKEEAFFDHNHQLSIEAFLANHDSDQVKLSADNKTRLLSYLKNYKIEEVESKRLVYNYLNLLVVLAKNFSYENNTVGALVTYFKALHVIESLKSRVGCLGLKDKVINKMVLLFVVENSPEEYTQTIELLTENVSSKYKRTFYGLMMSAYINEVNPTSNRSYKDFLDLAAKQSRSGREKIISSLNMGNFFSYSDVDKALEYYKTGLKTFEENSCSSIYYRVLLSIIEIETDKQKREDYLQLLDQVKECPPSIQNYVDFIKIQYAGVLSRSENINDQVQFLIKLRELAEELYPGKSTFHLQDYYTMNSCEILKLFSEIEYLDEEQANQVVNNILDTRLKDIHRQRLALSNNINLNNQNKNTINSKLLELNHFKQIKELDNTIYSDLFEAYINQIQEVVVPYEKQIVNFNDMIRSDKFKNVVLLNILKGESNYYGYLVKKGVLEVHELFSVAEVDSSLNALKKAWANREDINIDKFKSKIVEAIDFKGTEEMVIIPDGELINFPISELAGEEMRIQIYSHLYDYLEAEKSVISKNQMAVFSYSDQKSIKTKRKLTYPELPIGYEECLQLVELYNTREDKLYSGRDFSRKSLFGNEYQMIHISTHAFSSFNNRYENFLVLKDGLDADKVYGFEFYTKKKLPEVVVLSACETGVGLHQYGVGVQTLSRAFLDNGTQTVIKTLWKVNEKATAEFMVDMYTIWATGVSLYDALEETKEKFRNHSQYTHPYYWAGFVLEGNPNVTLDLSDTK